MEVKGIEKGDGNSSKYDDGKFIHAGGWLLVHENNSVDVNLVEAWEKQDFNFDSLSAPASLESDSHLGKVASQLQMKTYNLIKRRR